MDIGDFNGVLGKEDRDGGPGIRDFDGIFEAKRDSRLRDDGIEMPRLEAEENGARPALFWSDGVSEEGLSTIFKLDIFVFVFVLVE